MSSVAAVFGIASPVGRDLVSQLDVDPEIDAILGLDVEVPHDFPEKVTAAKLPEGVDELRARLREAGATMAAYLPPDACGADPTRAPAAALEAARFERFLAAIDGSPVESLVVASGGLIYGPGNGRDAPPVGEGATIAARGFPPGEADLAREAAVASFARAHPGLSVAIARLAPVVGAGTAGPAARFLSAKKVFGLQGYEPQLQFLHVEDAALAIFRLLKARAVGRYNLAPDDAVTLVSVARALKKTVSRYKPGLAAAIAGAGRALGLRGPAGLGPDLLPLLKNPPVLSNRKIKRDLGYAFKYSSEGAIREYERKM